MLSRLFFAIALPETWSAIGCVGSFYPVFGIPRYKWTLRIVIGVKPDFLSSWIFAM